MSQKFHPQSQCNYVHMFSNNPYKNAQSCPFHNSQKLERIKIFITVEWNMYTMENKSPMTEYLTNIILNKISQTQKCILHEAFI